MRAAEDIVERIESYRRDGLPAVQGWFDPETAEVLAAVLSEQARSGVEGDVAEIGVHHGKSFLMLANAAREGEQAIALDVFDDQEKNLDKSGLGDRKQFEANVARWASDVDVTIVQSSSLEVEPANAAAVFGNVRFFSVDGGHTAAITAHDLRLAEACVTQDGVVALDDILNAHWTGVVSGLAAYVGDGGTLHPFALTPNKLLLAPSAATAERYRERLRDVAAGLLGKRDVEFFGGVVDVYGLGSPRRREAQRAAQKTAENARRKLERLRRARRVAERRVAELEASTSWRATAPLRAVSSLVRSRRG
jgi:hypothetical protein